MNKKDNMPSWVYWGLWGIKTKKVALAFAIISQVIALIVVLIGIYVEDFFLIAFILVPLWYWLAIKWVDKNSSW